MARTVREDAEAAEQGALQFYRATVDLFHDGFYYAKGKVFGSFTQHSKALPVSAEEVDTEAYLQARELAATEAANKAAAATSMSLSPGGDAVVASATGAQHPGLGNEGSDLV
jgi:hypothetical protein